MFFSTEELLIANVTFELLTVEGSFLIFIRVVLEERCQRYSILSCILIL